MPLIARGEVVMLAGILLEVGVLLACWRRTGPTLGGARVPDISTVVVVCCIHIVCCSQVETCPPNLQVIGAMNQQHSTSMASCSTDVRDGATKVCVSMSVEPEISGNHHSRPFLPCIDRLCSWLNCSKGYPRRSRDSTRKLLR